MTRRHWLLAVVAVAAAGCRAVPRGPAALDAGHTTCSYCRMGVTDQRYASQVLVPGDDPRFFDDLGCLTRYLAEQPDVRREARVFVADHRTSEWVAADRAVFTRAPSISASMGSHVIAHASTASRDADPDARGGTAVRTDEILGIAN